MMAKYGASSAFAASLALALVLATSHALLRSAATLGSGSWTVAYLWRVSLALVLYGVVFGAYTYLLRWFDLSLLYPLYTGMSVVFVVATGILYFSEPLSLHRGIGVVLVIAGIYFLTAVGPR